MPPSPFRLHRAVQPPPAPPRDLATDCRYYRGLQSCGYATSCSGCAQYQPYQQRICLIHVHHLPRIVQSLPLLVELRRQFPDAQLTWVSSSQGCELLSGHPLVDRFVAFEPLTALMLGQQSFDLAINLDPAPEVCALAMALFARHKLGLGLGPAGQVIPLSAHARLWFANAQQQTQEAALSSEGAQQTFQTRPSADRSNVSYICWIHHGLGLTWRRERCAPVVQQSQRDRIRRSLLQMGWQPALTSLLVAVEDCAGLGPLEVGASLLGGALEQVCRAGSPVQVLLAGQPSERLLVGRLLEQFRAAETGRLFDAGTEHDLRAVPALVEVADVVVGPDGLMTSLAAAMGKSVVAVLWRKDQPVPELFGRGCIVELVRKPDSLASSSEISSTAAETVPILIEAIRQALEQARNTESLRQAG